MWTFFVVDPPKVVGKRGSDRAPGPAAHQVPHRPQPRPSPSRPPILSMSPFYFPVHFNFLFFLFSLHILIFNFFILPNRMLTLIILKRLQFDMVRFAGCVARLVKVPSNIVSLHNPLCCTGDGITIPRYYIPCTYISGISSLDY